MTTIGIVAPTLSDGHRALFEALASAYGVALERRTLGDEHVDAFVVLQADPDVVASSRASGKPCFIIADRAACVPCGSSRTLEFSDDAAIDPVFRGREVSVDDAAEIEALPGWLSGAAVLASKDNQAVWTAMTVPGCRHYYSSADLPELGAGEALFDHFCASRMARLLPLLQFLRSLEEGSGWQLPALQAVFMFDDPNLHAASYGFVDYREAIAQAKANNYHISFATIPLDAWFVHGGARDLFRSNGDRISLLIHGNDHVSNELGRPRSQDSMRGLVRQAIGRIAAFEAKSGVEVARVMAPPHGACSELALEQMGEGGFEAVCVSRGSLRFHNRGAGWLRTIGMSPAYSVAGLPVIPRFGLTEGNDNDILIAAFLRQPIVPITHHQAVADGYGLLNKQAAFINSLGLIRWTDLRTMSRSLYAHRRSGHTIEVRMLSNRIAIQVPGGVTALQLTGDRLRSHGDVLLWRVRGTADAWAPVVSDGVLAVRPGTSVEVSVRSATQRDEAPAVGPRRLAPMVRRVLTEVRDRTQPSVHRFTRAQRVDTAVKAPVTGQ